jgi:phosphoribosylformimino-5-aminoimidazole carboxamide ribotide isomerase
VIIFPAIDLKDGQCVRLKRGLMEEVTIFNADPAAQARSFADQGFRWLHCVDLNGAFAGKSVNADAIRAIRAAITLPIQLGGGIRDRAGVETWLDAGITRVILGTAALTNPAFVKEVARAYPGRIVVGADAKNGKVATQGWAEVSDLTPVELGKRFEDAGVAALLFTDIEALVAAREPNIEGVVVGRALYDGRIDPAAALAAAA